MKYVVTKNKKFPNESGVYTPEELVDVPCKHAKVTLKVVQLITGEWLIGIDYTQKDSKGGSHVPCTYSTKYADRLLGEWAVLRSVDNNFAVEYLERKGVVLGDRYKSLDESEKQIPFLNIRHISVEKTHRVHVKKTLRWGKRYLCVHKAVETPKEYIVSDYTTGANVCGSKTSKTIEGAEKICIETILRNTKGYEGLFKIAVDSIQKSIALQETSRYILTTAINKVC